MIGFNSKEEARQFGRFESSRDRRYAVGYFVSWFACSCISYTFAPIDGYMGFIVHALVGWFMASFMAALTFRK